MTVTFEKSLYNNSRDIRQFAPRSLLFISFHLKTEGTKIRGRFDEIEKERDGKREKKRERERERSFFFLRASGDRVTLVIYKHDARFVPMRSRHSGV